MLVDAVVGEDPPNDGVAEPGMVVTVRFGGSDEVETFLLGASTWRIEDITFDRVVVSPAPGEPGKMPFWRGDRPGRPPVRAPVPTS